MQQQVKNTLLAIRRNAFGKIYMFHFSYADVPAYKVEDYLSRAGTTDIKYIPQRGLIFEKHRIYDLNEYGKPLREIYIDYIAEPLLASRQESGLLSSVRFAANAAQEDLIIADSKPELANLDNLVFEHNLKHDWYFPTSHNKAITVSNTVTMQGACKLFINSAPYLQTLQLQGTCDIEIEEAPMLRTVLLDMGALWLPDNDESRIRSSASPMCNLNLGGLSGCTIKTRYLQGYRTIRNAPKAFFDGYTLEIHDSRNVRIEVEECVSLIKLKSCRDVQIICHDMAAVKDIQMLGCARVGIISSQKISNCEIACSDYVSFNADCSYIQAVHSEINFKGTLQRAQLSQECKLYLLSSTRITQEIELTPNCDLYPEDGVIIPRIRYTSPCNKDFTKATVVEMGEKDSGQGTPVLFINGVANKNTHPPIRDYPHILRIAPNVPVEEALDSVFAPKEYCYFNADSKLAIMPNIYISCNSSKQEQVLARLGSCASKAKFYPQGITSSTMGEWLDIVEGIKSLPSELQALDWSKL